MRLAIGSTFDYQVPLEMQFAALQATPFAAVSLGANLGHCDYLRGEVQQQVSRLAATHGLVIDSLHVPISPAYDISKSDPESRMGAVCRVALVIAAAVGLQTEVVILHLCHHAPKGYSQDLDALLSSLDVLIESAENMGVRLAAENLVTEPAHQFLRESLKTFDSEHFGLCYDSSHAHIDSRPPYQWLEDFGDRLLAVHLSDNDGLEDRHWIPFTGIVDWNEIAKQLRSNDYRGSLLLEVENRENLVAREFLNRATSAATKICELMEH
jgi:sugar phosphate isomerase/epimerase